MYRVYYMISNVNAVYGLVSQVLNSMVIILGFVGA